MKTLEEIRKAIKLTIHAESDDGLSGNYHFTASNYDASVVCSWGGGWEHVSISPYKASIIASWDDMCEIKSVFFKDTETVIQYHPPKTMNVNNVNNCLHMWRAIDVQMPCPPVIFVGIPSYIHSKHAFDEELEEAYRTPYRYDKDIEKSLDK